jgi:hypothetical protein
LLDGRVHPARFALLVSLAGNRPAGQQKEKTSIRIGHTTAARHDSKKLALLLYHARMGELAAHIHRLPVEREASRFRAYAKTYAVDTIAHRRGAEREREALKPLIEFFGDDLLSMIDKDRVRQYHTWRLAPRPGKDRGVHRAPSIARWCC